MGVGVLVTWWFLEPFGCGTCRSVNSAVKYSKNADFGDDHYKKRGRVSAEVH